MLEGKQQISCKMMTNQSSTRSHIQARGFYPGCVTFFTVMPPITRLVATYAKNLISKRNSVIVKFSILNIYVYSRLYFFHIKDIYLSL